jgi:hypothetical protein
MPALCSGLDRFVLDFLSWGMLLDENHGLFSRQWDEGGGSSPIRVCFYDLKKEGKGV